MFQSKHYQTIFERYQLGDFDRLWRHALDWFEEPNHRRGGWSGVAKLDLGHQAQDFLSVFIKKQQNHGRRTLQHPFAGEPTFRREFKRLKHLERKNIAAPKVVFYDEQQVDHYNCAILITETLLDYQPLDEVTEQLFNDENISMKQKRVLLKSAAEAVRQFHLSGLVHRALYPKHIFVKHATTLPEIALIDLEKSRFKQLTTSATYFDLSALLRHSTHWSRSDHLYFFLQYFQKSHLNRWLKLLCHLIIRRAAR